MKVAYVFGSPRAASYKLGTILPQLKPALTASKWRACLLRRQCVRAPAWRSDFGERLARVAARTGMLLMICDLCALERGLAEGEPRWCDENVGP